MGESDFEPHRKSKTGLDCKSVSVYSVTLAPEEWYVSVSVLYAQNAFISDNPCCGGGCVRPSAGPGWGGWKGGPEPRPSWAHGPEWVWTLSHTDSQGHVQEQYILKLWRHLWVVPQNLTVWYSGVWRVLQLSVSVHVLRVLRKCYSLLWNSGQCWSEFLILFFFIDHTRKTYSWVQ